VLVVLDGRLTAGLRRGALLLVEPLLGLVDFVLGLIGQLLRLVEEAHLAPE
jgi:hypothetical protein